MVPYPEDDTVELAGRLGGTQCLVMGSDWPHAEGLREPADFYAKVAALGEDARCRSRVLTVTGRHGLTLGAYPEISAPLQARGGQHRHTVAAVSVSPSGPPVLTVALSPP